MPTSIDKAYDLASERYASIGVDTERAMQTLATIPISLHCWQGDDVGGFESTGETLGGGLAVTGKYPGKARNADELRSDLNKALDLIPGRHRLNLHSLYAEHKEKVTDRDALTPDLFRGWIDWAKSRKVGVDFNPSYFSHPKAADGFTLASRDEGVRKFWVRHGQACRRIGAVFGRELGTACVTNIWIPDGYKDSPIDRKRPREILERSLDEVFSEALDPKQHLDSMEGKLFGIGSESYVVGSHEFYYGYAVRKQKLLCLDAGHFHPTETIADKISAVLMNLSEILLHVSRGVRWDSDHVVTFGDDLRATAEEIIRHNFQSRVHIGLDYFDASINRIAAWSIGTRAMLKALLTALLEPTDKLRELEAGGDLTSRLGMLEELKTFPSGAVWDRYCEIQNVPVGAAWLDEVKRYERDVLSKRA